MIHFFLFTILPVTMICSYFQPMGKKFGLDTSSNSSLWKDKVMVEVTYAILHSFNVSYSDERIADSIFLL